MWVHKAKKVDWAVKVEKAVFFGAHTDDEMVSAGTLHRLVRSGCDVTVVSFSPAATADDRLGSRESIKVVEPEWRQSMDTIGCQGWFCPLWQSKKAKSPWEPSANLANQRQDICQYVYDYCEAEKPDLAIILSPRDENTAHAVCGVECERVMRGRVPHVWRCLFPWNYGQGDRANLFVSLSPEDLEAKRRVIECYQSQKFRYNYLDMLMAQARADGLSVKVEAAEKYEIVRSVV